MIEIHIWWSYCIYERACNTMYSTNNPTTLFYFPLSCSNYAFSNLSIVQELFSILAVKVCYVWSHINIIRLMRSMCCLFWKTKKLLFVREKLFNVLFCVNIIDYIINMTLLSPYETNIHFERWKINN